MLHKLFDGLLDLLAPARCAGCASTLAKGPDESHLDFCPACAPLLEPLAPEALGLPYRALYRYGGPIADAIRRLKYEGISEVASALGPALSAAASPWQSLLDGVTAIPIAGAKLRLRGYNQSALLASQVASRLALPFLPHWLRRVRNSQRQVGQSRAARLAQARGAFLASRRVAGKTLLLVDDVRTTGATLAEATRALEQAGARAVYQLVVAEAEERGRYTPLY